MEDTDLRHLLSLFPIDRRDAERAAATIVAAPVGPAARWIATTSACLFALLAVAVIVQ